MFSTFKQRLILGIYIFILLSIPAGAFLVSQYRTTVKSSAFEQKGVKPTLQIPPKPATPSARQLLNASQQAANSTAGSTTASSSEPSPTPEGSSPTIATSYGPTLSLKVALEGRAENNQTTKLFVGIAEGALTANPKFVLSFSVDLPASGQYSNLSLAGLTVGSNYTALVKGAAQIAGSAAFTMAPTITNLNDGVVINLTSGDLNEDNVINSTDYTIAQKAIGSTSKSANWNETADINRDGMVNTFDLGIISKNIGKTGDSGAWTSPIPKTSTPSAGLAAPPMGSPDGSDGYWLWLPK
ncbi:hypothetical protein HY383_02385 [Candidatus Daviesbacteria bacterium]|nr:hypothetical protein [Candidatus Daviesbacteria bacterium]